MTGMAGPAAADRALAEDSQYVRLDGLNLADPDHTTPEEIAGFARSTTGWSPADRATTGHMGLSWWLAQGSDYAASVLKRYRITCHQTINDVAPARSPSYLALYSLLGYETGVSYVLRGLIDKGLTRQEILETIALSFVWSGPAGMETVARVTRAIDWPPPDPGERFSWPEGWAADPAAFESGLDFTSPDLSAAEREMLESWYIRYAGEVPPSVRLLAEFAPAVLKAQRGRYEKLLIHQPKQVMPIARLHFSVQTRTPAGIRENVLLARGFGVTRDFVRKTIQNALVYGGLEAAGLVEREAGDVLRDWREG
jgi:hypothetical protein